MLSKLSGAVVDAEQSTRSLLLIWRNPQSRRYSRVARLDKTGEGAFLFRYLSSASKLEGFFPLDEYPDFGGLYSSQGLPAFFANRVMSTSRPGYREYLEWLGIEQLDDVDVPVEVLARTGGGRVTNTFHVVDMPRTSDSRFRSRFFISGIRHADGGLQASRSVRVGDELVMRSEPDNPVNGLAKIIDTNTQQQIGWLPDWLCDEVASLEASHWSLSLSVEKVNEEAPPRSKILCRLEATRDEGSHMRQ